ncbi:Uncharacterised protein [Yersinia frederiksenii]|nr:Uncharacterised protein [Yersinia frederiksenii]CNC72287.1 Uncharacterised protein [Yersinia frederiksenii]CNJ06004.1 Uncharacterised protein [Yersinia frederiksenii]
MQNSFCVLATWLVPQIFQILAIKCVVWGISYNDLLSVMYLLAISRSDV